MTDNERQKRPRRGKHRGEPMSLREQFRAGRRSREATANSTGMLGARRMRRHA